jgi:hypothetical protein
LTFTDTGYLGTDADGVFAFAQSQRPAASCVAPGRARVNSRVTMVVSAALAWFAVWLVVVLAPAELPTWTAARSAGPAPTASCMASAPVSHSGSRCHVVDTATQDRAAWSALDTPGSTYATETRRDRPDTKVIPWATWPGLGSVAVLPRAGSRICAAARPLARAAARYASPEQARAPPPPG